MTKKKKILLISILAAIVLLAAGIVVARVAFDTDVLRTIGDAISDAIENIKEGDIADAENDYDPYYESFYDGPNDPGVKIDGKLDEDIWKNKGWYQNTFLSMPGSDMPKWKITSHMSDYGFYIGAVIEDSNLMNDGQHTMESNSALEFYYFKANVGEKVSGLNHDRGYFVVDLRGDVHSSLGKFKRAVTIDGELNSGKTKSATMEMFFPWQFFGIDTSKGIPENIYLYPIYCAVFQGKDTISTSISSMDTVIKPELYRYKDFWRFGKDGYVTADREGAVVGDSSTGLAKTGNWNLSGEKNGVIRSENGSKAHYVYFKDKYCNNFIAETTIVPIKQKDSEAKAGFYFVTSDGQYHLATLGMPDSILVDGVKGTKNVSKYVLSTYNSKKASYEFYPDSQIANPNATKKEGVKLTVIKQGKYLYYFADDKFLASEELDYMNADVYPAMISWAADASFKNYSCEEIDKTQVREYLNKMGVYAVDAAVNGSGGTVEASKAAVAKGQKYDITVTTKSGYTVKSILVNGKEKIADARRNAKDGVYTVTATAQNQEIRVSFERCEGSKLSGVVKGAGNPISAKLTVTSTSNGILRYLVNADNEKGYTVIVPSGNYRIVAQAEDYITDTVSVSVNKDTKKDIVLKPSMFAATVNVNGKTANSNSAAWDRSREAEGIVTGSYSLGSSTQPLYFAKPAKAALFSSTIRYSTDFVDGGSYQYDLLGGLSVSDGSRSGWFGVRQHGVVYNLQWIEHVIGYDVLSMWDKSHMTVNVEIFLINDKFHIFVDGVYATELPVSKVIGANYKGDGLALGLAMHTDKMADIEFSKISYNTDEKQVKSLFDKRKAAFTIPSGTLFSQEVKVNGNTLQSVPYHWDLSNIKNNTVSCKDGNVNQPLWFAKTGKTALVQATVNRLDDKSVANRETQPLAGIRVSDGKKTGYIGIRADAIVTNDNWEHLIGKDLFATWYTNELTTGKVDFVLKGNKIQIYVDGIFVKSTPLSTVVPGIANNATVAIGLVTEASGKAANMQFADVKYTTDSAKVDAFIKSKDPTYAIPAGTLFAGALTVNGKRIESTVPVWDITNIKNNKVIANNSNCRQPLWFAGTGKTALVNFKATRLDDKTVTGRESQPLAGIRVSDGTKSGYIGIRADAIVTNDNWEHIIGKTLFASWTPSEPTADIDFVLKNNKIQIYVDGIFVTEKALSSIVPGIASNATVAIGLLSEASGKNASMEFANVKYTTDSAKVDAFIKEKDPASAVPDGTLFAGALTVNGKRIESTVPVWDITDIENNKVIANNSSSLQPLWFASTGKAALASFKATRLDDKTVSNRESQPMAGIRVSDGTKSGYIGIRADAIVTNDNWEHLIGKTLFASWSPSVPTADIDFVLKSNKIQIYVDGIFVTEKALSSIVSGIANDATVAIGLLSEASGKNASMEFANVKYTTDTAKVDAFIKENDPASAVPDGTLFAGALTVNSKRLESIVPVWDITDIANNRVIANNSSSTQPLWFAKTGKTALVGTTATRLDDKTVSNRESQPMVGIRISDGTKSGYIGVRADAIVYNDNWEHLIGKNMFVSWTPTVLTGKINFVLKDNAVQIYVDDLFVKSVPLSTVVPGIANNAEVAIGLLSEASGKNASMEFAKVEYTTDATAVNKYLEKVSFDPSVKDFIGYARALGKGYENGEGSAKVSVGANTTIFIGDSFFDRRSFWTDFYTDDYKGADAFCAGIGSTTTANWKYLLDEVLAVCGNTQPKNIAIHLGTNDLWDNSCTADAVVDRLKSIFASIHQKFPSTNIYYFGITHRGDNSASDRINAVNSAISSYSATQPHITYVNTPSKITASMLKTDNLHPKLENYTVFVRELARAGCVVLDKSGQPFEIPMSSKTYGLFADEVELNSTYVTSASSKWDLTNAETGSIKASSTLGSSLQPMFFSETGKAALVQFTAKVANAQGDPMAGIWISDGTKYAFIGVRGGGIFYRPFDGPWNLWHGGDYWNSQILAPQWGGPSSADIDFVVANGNIVVYVNKLYSKTISFSEALPGLSSDKNLAFGLVTYTDSPRTYDMTFSNIKFTTDSVKIAAYPEEETPTSVIPAGTLFADSVTVNSKKLNSVTAPWDITNIKCNTVVANNSNSVQPLWFNKTGATALVKTFVTRLDDKTATNRESQPMAGIRVSDGTNSGYIGVRASNIVINNSWDNCIGKDLFVNWYTNEPKTAQVDFVLKDNKIQVFVDGLFVKAYDLSTVVPGVASNANVAIGLLSEASGKTASMQFGSVEFSTDSTTVNSYLSAKE